jgi:hypothetical protein
MYRTSAQLDPDLAFQSSQCVGNCSRDTSCSPIELDRADGCGHVCDRLCNEDGDEDIDQA